MPGNRRLTMKTIKGKEGVHPGSRKAGQLDRVNLRAAKLKNQTKLRRNAYSAKLSRPAFFLHSLSSPHPLSLPSLRALISDVYLTRHDIRIAELVAERRAGRPKGKELVELEEIRRREVDEWETGIEVPDLTHAPTTKLLFSWLEADTTLSTSHVDLLRQIRVARLEPDIIVLSKAGRTDKMGLGGAEGVEEGDDWTGGAGGAMEVEAGK